MYYSFFFKVQDGKRIPELKKHERDSNSLATGVKEQRKAAGALNCRTSLVEVEGHDSTPDTSCYEIHAKMLLCASFFSRGSECGLMARLKETQPRSLKAGHRAKKNNVAISCLMLALKKRTSRTECNLTARAVDCDRFDVNKRRESAPSLKRSEVSAWEIS